MKFRKLRIAWSVFWGLACVLLIVLWVRSYPNRCEQCWGHFPNGTSFELDSHIGIVWIGVLYRHNAVPFHYKTFTLSDDTAEQLRSEPTFRFMDPIPKGICIIKLPYWLLMFIPFATASLPWLRWRFSLRTLLIGMTLVGVVLGWIVYATRH